MPITPQDFIIKLPCKKLDEAVSAAHGWKYDLGDEGILKKLLSLNLGEINQRDSHPLL